MQDLWQSGDPYEYYMGRWSKLVAELFVDWLSPRLGLRWLDVGCGTGALGKAIINGYNPEIIMAVDQSEDFVHTAQQRLGDKAECKVGNALSLPISDSSVDITVSGLVLNFISEPEKALAEMRRVTIKGGTVAAYIWDYAGVMEFLNYFWDVAVELNPNVSVLHEGRRFPKSNAEELRATFKRAGFLEIEVAHFEIATKFSDFDDYWQPFLGGQGPAPTYVSNLKDTERTQVKDVLIRRLPIQKDGSILLSARAWSVKGLV